MKYFLYILAVSIVLLCGYSVKRNSFFSRNYHQLTTRYTMCVNGIQALKSGEKDMENRRCFRFLTDCIQSIRAARYILACMRIIPMQSSFINRLVSGLTGNTIARGNISWSIIFERCRASQRSICAESS